MDEFAVDPFGEDEDDGLSVSADFATRMGDVQRAAAAAQAKQDQYWASQLQAATQRLQQQQITPSLAERLFSLSAAFAQPSRVKGFAGTMGNVMPVLASQLGEQREARIAHDQQIEALRAKYMEQQFAGQQRGFANQIAALKAGAQASKPPKQRTGFNPVTGRLYDLDTGSEIPLGTASGGAADIQTKTIGGTTYYGVGGKWFDNLDEAMKAGGPTQPASDGFPSGNPLDPNLGR